MFTAIKEFIWGTPTGYRATNTQETNMKATIQPVGDKFALFSGGNLVQTYARRRDAVRGATRRELHLI